MLYTDLDNTRAFKFIRYCKPFDVRQMTSDRVSECIIQEAGSMRYSYAAMPVDGMLLKGLQNLADEQEVVEKYRALAGGEIMNIGEKRMVLHHLTRGVVNPNSVTVLSNRAFYEQELNKIKLFSEDVRRGAIAGSTGKPFEHVVQIGIGGSDLGPRALCYALNLIDVDKKIDARFISNVDPDDAAGVLSDLDLETTLFILVSKSGTTQETLTNRDLVFKVMESKGITRPLSHMVAVTSNTSPLAQTRGLAGVFFMDDFIGGRYSSTSAVGGLILSIAYGFDTFKAILDGAHQEDLCALEKDIKNNGPLMDALIGIYLRNVLNMPYTAILPYSQCLNRFPAHLQQLDMESNGKSVDRFGFKVDYKTGPVIFGEPGTNGQHSFYQHLHQGTDVVPVQFIGFKQNQGKLDNDDDNFTSRQKLNANLAAQIVAFAMGQENKTNLNKNFAGGRPSSLLYADKLTPFALGALLSHYENKIMFQGFLWNINSFDQEGVQLGKVLAKRVQNGCEGDSVLAAYSTMLGL